MYLESGHVYISTRNFNLFCVPQMPFQLQAINTATCQNANKLGLRVGATSVPKKSFIFFCTYPMSSDGGRKNSFLPQKKLFSTPKKSFERQSLLASDSAALRLARWQSLFSIPVRIVVA
jgi:hypothetical protein